MRDVYTEQLDTLAETLSSMCTLVADALEKATRALLEADLQLAEEVISADAKVDEVRALAEERAFGLLVLQAPVATDLRIVVSAIHARATSSAWAISPCTSRRPHGAATRSTCCPTSGGLLRGDGPDRGGSRAQGGGDAAHP